MRTVFLSATIAMFGVSAMFTSSAYARWEQLGCQNVGFITDRDVIKVGRQDGRFKSIRLNVSKNEIFLNDVKVVYANGQVDDLPVRANIKAGSQTRAINLKGERRAINQIEMVYRSKPSFKGQAQVCVFGNS